MEGEEFFRLPTPKATGNRTDEFEDRSLLREGNQGDRMGKNAAKKSESKWATMLLQSSAVLNQASRQLRLIN